MRRETSYPQVAFPSHERRLLIARFLDFGRRALAGIQFPVEAKRPRLGECMQFFRDRGRLDRAPANALFGASSPQILG